MNNEERMQQIRDAARYKYPDERIHFIDGATWADKHPKFLEGHKIYAITHRGFEFDDIGYPSLEPIKFFTTREKRDSVFKELVTKQIEWFEKCKNSKYSNPNNYEIGENTNDDFLELYMDKWCYEWGKAEFEMEV